MVALVSMTSLSLIYKLLAGRLNTAENWRTESEYQDALIIKSIVFEALNNFYLLIFILFLKGMLCSERCVTFAVLMLCH